MAHQQYPHPISPYSMTQRHTGKVPISAMPRRPVGLIFMHAHFTFNERTDSRAHTETKVQSMIIAGVYPHPVHLPAPKYACRDEGWIQCSCRMAEGWQGQPVPRWSSDGTRSLEHSKVHPSASEVWKQKDENVQLFAHFLHCYECHDSFFLWVPDKRSSLHIFSHIMKSYWKRLHEKQKANHPQNQTGNCVLSTHLSRKSYRLNGVHGNTVTWMYPLYQWF